MIKYNQLGESRYNQLGTVSTNEEIPKNVQIFNRLAGALPVVYSQNEERLAVLENADMPVLEQEVNGIDTLTFNLPFHDQKKEFLKNENLVKLVDRRYIIRKLRKIRSGDNLEYEVFCEATWYDLQKAEPLEVWSWENATPKQMLADMLDGTGWSVGKVEITEERNLELDEKLINRLKGIKELPDLFNGELVFHTENNSIDFVEPIGRESGAAIVYQKNMDSIEAEYSTEKLTTKLYMYGKNGMTIEEAHPEGKTFIENYQYTNKTTVMITKDERFTNPFHLYDNGVKALDVLSRPTGSYIVKMSDLSDKSGLSHEEFFLGDAVWVFDKELGINERKRIMKWKYNPKRPDDTEVELESKQPTLSDLLTGVQEGDSFLQSEDSVQRDEMLNLSMFNYLLNSRADDGFSYWTNEGWEIDPVNGYSGNASFLATADPDVTKTLSQEVFPSHRDDYAISFRASFDNLQLGPNGEVGVYITVKYEDGTQDDPVFIPLVQE